MNSQKIIQALGIPYSALISIIFGMMILSFPIGAYLFFNSDLGYNITADYPLSEIEFFGPDSDFRIPTDLVLGDVFIVLWSFFLIVFAISIVGPKISFLKNLGAAMGDQKKSFESNYLVIAITWFSILILLSGVVNYIQESVGISTEPPLSDNKLIQFFDVSKAPLIEEVAFRMLLIGLPLYAFYSHKASVKLLFKSLWRPSHHLHIYDKRKPIILIVIVAVIFGFAHIIAGESWSDGKLVQATISGIIIGWVYFRYGFAPALLIHWATNYFIFSYVFIISEINEITVKNAFGHSMINTLEILFVVTGIFSISILVLSRYFSKKEEIKDLGQF